MAAMVAQVDWGLVVVVVALQVSLLLVMRQN